MNLREDMKGDSMTESKLSVSQRELAEAQKLQTYILSIKDAVNCAVEQGLWITLSLNMFAITRKIYEDENHFLYGQRYQLIKLLKALSAPGDSGIGQGKIISEILGVGGIPNPLLYMFQFLRPLTGEMERHGWDDGRLYYAEMDPMPTLILTFTVPGLMRLLGQQMGEIIPL